MAGISPQPQRASAVSPASGLLAPGTPAPDFTLPSTPDQKLSPVRVSAASR